MLLCVEDIVKWISCQKCLSEGFQSTVCFRLGRCLTLNVERGRVMTGQPGGLTDTETLWTSQMRSLAPVLWVCTYICVCSLFSVSEPKMGSGIFPSSSTIKYCWITSSCEELSMHFEACVNSYVHELTLKSHSCPRSIRIHRSNHFWTIAVWALCVKSPISATQLFIYWCNLTQITAEAWHFNVAFLKNRA